MSREKQAEISDAFCAKIQNFLGRTMVWNSYLALYYSAHVAQRREGMAVEQEWLSRPRQVMALMAANTVALLATGRSSSYLHVHRAS